MGYLTHAFSAALTIPAIVGGALKAQVLIPVFTEGSLNVLGVPIGDLTSGFRAARAEVFRAISLAERGFGIQLEGTVKAHRAGFRCTEVPITLGVRKSGYSKMAYTRSFWLGYARLVVRLWLAPRVLDSTASTLYAEVEDSQSRGATL